MSILAYVFIMHIHFMLMVTQGTSSRRHPALLTITHKNCGRDPIYSISPLFIHPVPLCSVYLNQFRAHSLQPQLLFQFVITYTHHNPLFCRNPATCVFSLLLSDAPFTDRAVFSIQGQRISHIFTVIARCWHAGIIFFSFSVG